MIYAYISGMEEKTRIRLLKRLNQKAFQSEVAGLWPLARGSLTLIRKPCIRPGCPHLGYQSCAEAQAEMERIKVENRDLRRVFDQATAAFQEKEAEIRRLKEETEADMVRFSMGINVDETNWPRGPVMEWLWTFTNHDCAFFKIAPSRAGSVPASVLGEHYGGVLGSDCFSAYNTLEALAKQKCLTHYERAAKNLEKFYPQDQPANLFAVCLKDIFKRARQAKRDWLAGITRDEQAHQMAKDFEEELDQLIESPLQNADAENLRKRLITHRDENFTFLRFKDIDPDNNRAERALRPSVVMRKITYGNNSESGARNHETLMTLVETSKLHNANHLDLMLELASGRNPAQINPIFSRLGVAFGEASGGAISPGTGPPPILLKNLHLGGLCAFARE